MPEIGLALALWGLVPPARSAADRPAVEEIVQRLARQAESFWKDLPMVTCKETVVQAKLDARGKRLEERRTVYDYTIALAREGAGIAIQEFRTPQQEPPGKPKHSLLVSEGFSTLVLIFHPHFQPSFQFALAPGDSLQEAGVLRIQFTHREGMSTPSVLQTRDGNVPIEWTGTAWVDAHSGNVLRIQARLKKPLAALGIEALNSDVAYALTDLEGSDHSHLLPQSAVIEARTSRQQWRNTHRFEAFRRFTVDVKLQLDVPD
ncbi:MAG TPA: hypothetical protein VNN17_08225 [Terriglobia bacterium]|nr:hypothetical protein [Terriglobia bacterium]